MAVDTAPPIRTAWGRLVTVERHHRGGVALAYRGSQFWDDHWQLEWNNGHGSGNESMESNAVAVGGVEEHGQQLLAFGMSDLDGDGREEAEIYIYCIPTLMRDAVASGRLPEAPAQELLGKLESWDIVRPFTSMSVSE